VLAHIASAWSTLAADSRSRVDPFLDKERRAGILCGMAGSVGARLGGSMSRAPYVWLAATILAYLVTVLSLASVAKDTKQASTVIAVIASVLIAYSCVAWALLPRIFRRARKPVTDEQLAMLRWTFAMTPFLYGFASVAAGGQQWSLALGSVVSVVLLVLAVKAIRRLPLSA
jgi:hypothetical protein